MAFLLIWVEIFKQAFFSLQIETVLWDGEDAVKQWETN